MKGGRSIRKPKKIDLIFKMVIVSFEDSFLFIIFKYFYLIIDICQIQLDKLVSLAKAIEKFLN